MNKPFSQACENNKTPILNVLENTFSACSHVLEIGTGTGQHAVFFAANLPHLKWQTSDQPEYHAGINQWLKEYPLTNLLPPVSFTVGQDDWPAQTVDAVFTANTAHIMQRHQAKLMMQMVAKYLPEGGVFCQYGPFTHNGEFNSQSNQDFHQHLIANGYGGYRDINELTKWADTLTLKSIKNMPANNLLLIWQK